MKEDRNRVCPVELAGSLDTKIRRWIQNPQRILSPFLQEGMAVLDVGCGPGFFSIEMAKIVGVKGKVFAVDLQDGMLQKIRDKIKGTNLEEIVQPIKCEKDKIFIPVKVDFILAFYMVHEVPNKKNFFNDLRNLLMENGRILIVEPPFHVSKKEFIETMKIAESIGLIMSPGPKLFMNLTSILSFS